MASTRQRRHRLSYAVPTRPLASMSPTLHPVFNLPHGSATTNPLAQLSCLLTTPPTPSRSGPCLLAPSIREVLASISGLNKGVRILYGLPISLGQQAKGKAIGPTSHLCMVRRTQAATTYDGAPAERVYYRSITTISPDAKALRNKKQRAGGPIDSGRLLARLVYNDVGSEHQNVGSRLILTWPILEDRSGREKCNAPATQRAVTNTTNGSTGLESPIPSITGSTRVVGAA